MKLIPNILTSFRLLIVPFIIYLFVNNQIKLAIILIIIGSITDFIDGKLARILNAKTELGAKLDAVSDKVFSGGLILSIATRFHFLFINFILELAISAIGLYFFSKTKKAKSLYIGKIKTWFLFVTVIFGFIVYYDSNIYFLLILFSIVTAILQLICVFEYKKDGIKLTS